MTEKDFIKSCVSRIPEFVLKKFPEEFTGKTKTKKLKMPGKTLLLGTELFGTFEIISHDGSIEFHVESLAEAKYLLYANRSKPSEIDIPKDMSEIEKIVKNYEKHLDSILLSIEEDFREQFPESKGFNRVSNQIFKSLNLIRY